MNTNQNRKQQQKERSDSDSRVFPLRRRDGDRFLSGPVCLCSLPPHWSPWTEKMTFLDVGLTPLEGGDWHCGVAVRQSHSYHR